MNRSLTLLTGLLYFVLLTGLKAQQVPVGQWRDELPYTLVNSLADAGDRIYASTPYAVFYKEKSDNSVVRITKISGLSDIGISCISYSKEYKTLLVAYSNANIDIIRDNSIINVSDIKRANILGNKTINSIFFRGSQAYLSCGFGIVVLDIAKDEIRDTYYIGRNGSQVNVMALTTDNHDTLFAATERGIYKAWADDPNLSNYATWQRDKRIDTSASYTSIAWFSGRVVVNKRLQGITNDTLYQSLNGAWSRIPLDGYNPVMHLSANNDFLMVANRNSVQAIKPDLTPLMYVPGAPYPLTAISDRDGIFWTGDTYVGLVMYNPANYVIDTVTLSGPSTALAFSMTSSGNEVCIAPGGHDATYAPLYYQPQIYHNNNSSWYNVIGYYNPIMNSAYDIVAVAIDPKDSRHMMAASFGKGVLELYDDKVTRRFTYGNSTLRNYSGSDTADIRVGGCAYDAQGNFWAVCSHTNNCLSVKQGDTWTMLSVPIEIDLGQLMITSKGQKWIQMRYGTMNASSVLVYNDNKTPSNPADDSYRLMNSAKGSGAIPGTTLLSMAEDRNGEVWVGTEKGVGVFYSPENIFTGDNFDAQQILVNQGGYVQYLLENESVTAIAVDGANQKWMGTDRGGLFLFSPDGTKEIFHFTAENSPLLSNRITALTINADGNVFIGTDNGVISFRGSATPPADSSTAFAFPNPVREDYEGCIAVRGLPENAEVRITDINGTVVFSGKAGTQGNSTCDVPDNSQAQLGVVGGQVVWDGRNFDGKRARSGVYLVWAADETGTQKVVTKILVVH